MTGINELLAIAIPSFLGVALAFCVATEVAVRLGADRSRFFSRANRFDDR